MRSHAHERINPPKAKRRTGNRKPVSDNVFGWASAATLSVVAAAFLLVITGPARQLVDPDSDLITGTVDQSNARPGGWDRVTTTSRPKSDIGLVPALITQTQINKLGTEIEALKEREATLKAENSSLARRITALESAFDGITTGSISANRRTEPSRSAAEEIVTSAPVPVPGGSVAVKLVPLDSDKLDKAATGDDDAVPAELPAAAVDDQATEEAKAIPSTTTRTNFGVDLGGAENFGDLAQRWKTLKSAHPDLFGELVPMVAAREDIDKAIELRLVAGPFGNAADAAVFCARFHDEGVRCRPAVFEGQRLIVQNEN
ncbi:MAG: hypothetical protein KDJ16_06690 [Hyphomicrobiales bacterium]|nr:hypothetical protein [Hyphomicrobiales bacterium]